MSAPNAPITVLPAERKEELLWESVPIITCAFSMPQLQGEGRGVQRIDRYYRHVEAALLKALKGFYPALCAQAEQALAASRPIPLCYVRTDFETAYLDEQFLSIRWCLYRDTETRQFCDLWELPWGAPASARALLPRKLRKSADPKGCLLRFDGIYQVSLQGETLLSRRSSQETISPA